jgi:hypothetical protein
MATIFISYARADGQSAADRLRGELEQAGFQIWRDIERMQGGLGLKDQLRQALKTVDVVVVLLTPDAITSKYVEWEWETAITLGKRVIPLLILPCSIPDELQRLHYHNLSTDKEYFAGLLALVRDINSVAIAKPVSEPDQSSTQPDGVGGRGIAIAGNAENSNLITGDGNTVNTHNSDTTQQGKYNIRINKADNIRIGDDYNS